MFASSGERGEPCGMPRRWSRASVVRVFRPRSSVSSTAHSSHILIRCSTRRSTTRRATDLRRSDSRLPPSLSRVTPSAVSEHFSELLGCPISRSLPASCVGLELRPLPSTSITRLPRYSEPLRHPSAPGLSLTGVRLIIPDHAVGLPVLRALSLCTCCRHYPGAATGRIPRSSHPAVSAFPGRGRRVGLHIDLFEACSAFTRVAACTLARSPIRDPLIEGFRHFVTSMTAPIASGWSESPGALHPLESAALSRRTPLAVLPVGACDRRLGWRAAIRNQRPETAVGCRIWTIVADEIAEVQSTTH